MVALSYVYSGLVSKTVKYECILNIYQYINISMLEVFMLVKLLSVVV